MQWTCAQPSAAGQDDIKTWGVEDGTLGEKRTMISKGCTRQALTIILLLMLTACSGGADSTATRTPTIKPTSRPTVTQSPIPSPSPRPSPLSPTTEDPEIPSRSLSDEGPWLIFNDNSGVWAFNPDGSGLTKLAGRNLSDPPMGVKMVAAPGGAQAAFLEYNGNLFAFPQLSIISLPGGEWRTLPQLLSDEIELALLSNERQYAFIDVMAAAGPWNEAAWSSEGDRLAFNGAMDGPSSDLYVFSIAEDAITRLTSGPTQSIDPVWSPDDRYIVHGGASQLGWGASGWGYNMDAVWAVKADGSEVTRLYSSKITGFENVLGWLSDTVFLADTIEFLCTYSDLRTVNVETGETRMLWQGGYDGRAYDPESKILLITIVDAKRMDPECAPDEAPGLYLLSVDDGALMHIPYQGNLLYESAYWSSEAGRIFLYGNLAVLSVDPDGEIRVYPAPELRDQPLAVAPAGQRWAMIASDGGLWIGGEDGDLLEIYTGEAHHPTWSLDGQTLFFFGEEDSTILYLAREPDFKLTMIADGFYDNPVWGNWSELVWVWP